MSCLLSNGHIATTVKCHGQLILFSFKQVEILWMLRLLKLIAKSNQAKLTPGRLLCRLQKMLADTLLILECNLATTSDLVRKFGVTSKSLRSHNRLLHHQKSFNKKSSNKWLRSQLLFNQKSLRLLRKLRCQLVKHLLAKVKLQRVALLTMSPPILLSTTVLIIKTNHW